MLIAGFNAFSSLAHNELVQVLNASMERNKAELIQVSNNHLFRRPGAQSLFGQGLSHAEKFVIDHFYRFNEIQETTENLRHIASFAVRARYPTKQVSSFRQFRYHLYNYFQELYILKERLKGYANFAQKAYRYSSNSRQVADASDYARKAGALALKSAVDIRGQHTHLFRYETEDIRRVSAFETLSKTPASAGGQIYAIFYRRELAALRRQYKKLFSDNESAIDALLDGCFMRFEGALYENGRLILPNRYRSHS